MTVVVLSSSPRRDGNSRALADALAAGVRDTGSSVDVVEVNEEVSGLLRDCRRCRLADGRCGIDDGYARLVHERLVPAEAIVYATPLYWYGMSAALKNVFDRLFCYTAAAYPRAEEVVAGLADTRTALLLSSEETFPAAAGNVIGQVQEASRYLQQSFVGAVRGIGNRRGEVGLDPDDPLTAACRLGHTLLDRTHSDYTIADQRPGAVWDGPQGPRPARQDR